MTKNDTKSKGHAAPRTTPGRKQSGHDAPDGNRAGREQTSGGRPVSSNLSGRVTHDDRGNAVWEWANTTGAFIGGGATEHHLRKLENSSLALEDDVPPPSATAKANPLGTAKGYSPYDSGVLAKTAAPRKKKDLRKLSEWLKLKKQFGAKTPD